MSKEQEVIKTVLSNEEYQAVQDLQEEMVLKETFMDKTKRVTKKALPYVGVGIAGIFVGAAIVKRGELLETEVVQDLIEGVEELGE